MPNPIVYMFNIAAANAADLWRFIPLVSPAKQDRITRFYFPKDKLRCLFGDILVRYLVSAQKGIRPRDIHIVEDTYGKPYIQDRPDILFNISHSKKWVVCAIGSGNQGIDIEHMPAEVPSVERKVLSPRELAEYATLDSQQKRPYFYRVWTLKESFSKYCGVGLEMSFPDIAADMSAPYIRMSYQGTEAGGRHRFLDHEYSLALCEDSGEDFILQEIYLDELNSWIQGQSDQDPMMD